MERNELVELHQSAKALHDEIRKMFGPAGNSRTKFPEVEFVSKYIKKKWTT